MEHLERLASVARRRIANTLGKGMGQGKAKNHDNNAARQSADCNTDSGRERSKEARRYMIPRNDSGETDKMIMPTNWRVVVVASIMWCLMLSAHAANPTKQHHSAAAR